MPINEYDDILLNGKIPSSGNEYFDLVGGQKDVQKQQLQSSFYKAKDKQPDHSADIQKLSKRSNLPEDFVERNYDELKRQSESKTDYTSLINNSPATATYMSNPYNAATSKDDIEPLSKMETSVRLMRNRNAVARAGSDITQAAMTGWNDLNASTWHLAMAYGLTDIDTAAIQIAEANKRSQELRSKVPDYAKDFNDVMSKQGQDVDRAFSLFSEGYDSQKNGQIGQALKDYGSGSIKTVGEVLDMVGSAVVRPRGLAYSTIQNLAHSLPSLITGFAGAKAGGFAGAKIGAGVALIAGQAGPQAAAPEELVTVPTFSAVGGSLGGIGGFVSGSFAGQVPVEVGAWINEQLSGKGYDLTDPEQIKQAYTDTEFIADIKAEAERKGITTAAVDSIFNMFAGKLVAGAKGTRLSTTLRTAGDIGVQSLGEGSSEFAGQVAAKKGLEGTSLGEAVQEGITSLGHSFGETVIGASTRGVDIQGKGKEVAQETIKKARDLFSKNPIKAAQEVSQETGKAVKAQQDAQALSDIAEAVKESKTAQRNPDAIKEILDIATQGDDDSNVYFQTQDWDDYWTSKGESPSEKAAEIMGDGGKSYFEAKNNGDNFSLPLSDYVSKLASTDDFNGLLSSARTDVEGMSLQEAKDFLAGLPEVMDTLAEEASQQDQQAIEASEQVAKNITEQLVDAGFEQTTAETYGQLYKSTFSTLAQRTGKSVDELFGRFNVKIQRSDQVADVGKELFQTAPNNQGTFDPSDPRILFQKAENLGGKLRNIFQKGTRVKGSFQFGNEKFNINLFKDADLSTFLHESGHFYLEMMGDLVDSGLSNDDQIKSDYESILKWLGVESRDQIKTEHHEKFARGFEAYLMEGKAPSSALRTAFAKFRAWLTSIYRSIRNLNAPISKEIRGVFDRLLATDEEIAVAQEEANITQIFTSAEQAGMTDEEFKLYEDTVREASQMAQDSLQQKILKQYRREQEKWWKDRTEEVRQQVTEEVNNDKNYIALSVLQRGTLPDGSPLPEGMEAIKISKKALTDTYDKSILKKLPKPYIYTQSDDGVHQDVAAEMLGYTSGDEMINALSGLPNKKQAIDTMTDARMRDQYGDKLIDGSLAEDARIAVNNDERAKVILAELKALRKKQQEVKPFIDAQKNVQKEGVSTLKSAIPTIDVVRRIAKNTIAGKKVRNVKPYNYFVAARKSSKQAFEALSKNNYDDAAKFKQQELLSMELYREATRVQDEVDKTVNFMKRFAKKSTREKIAKAGSDYLDQIDSLLDRFDFAKGISLKRIDRRKSLLEWVQSQEEQGLVADIPEKLLDEAYKMHYKDLTIDELTGLKDSVKNIEHFARMKNRLLKAAKQRAFDEVIDEAVASVEANSKGKRKVDIETRLPQEETKRRIEGYFAEHRKFASLVYQMDGFEDGGTLWEILTRPMNEAGDKEAVMNEQATEKLKEIFSAYTTKELTQLYKKEFVPAINDSLTKMARLSVALNWGNADSKQKVMDGRNWSQDQVEAILDMLDERDWNFVQNVWDFVNSYWAESKALAERVNGVAPGKVEAEPVQTKYGQFRGGYYPLKYDDILSDRAYENAAKEAAEKAMRGAFIRATTKHGHRKQRVEGVKMPIRLDLGVLFEHVSEIIHDQTHYEFLIDTNKILKDERMKTAIKENYGDIIYRELTKTVNDVAAGMVPAQNSFEKAINWLRSGTSIAAMGWNLMTSLQQPLGLTQSMVRIGPKWVAKGISRWIGSPQKMQATINDIYSKSDMMRLRGKTQMREINEIRNKLRIRGKLSAIEDSYFYLIAKGQMIADIPTWLGAYEKAWGTDTEMTEEKAARLADQAVLDSQGGGQVKDLADIQRGGPLKKLWTNFYSYFNTTYNLTSESFKKHNIKSASGIGALAVDLLMLYSLPAILGVLLKDAIKGGDDEPLPEKLIREQAGYVLGTMVGVRELGSVVQGFYGYEGPAGTRFFGEFGGLIKQIEQGEADAAFWKSLNQTGGILFHYPAGQIDRTFRGLNQLSEGQASSPLVLITGPKRQ